MQNIISKAESLVKTDQESQTFLLIASDFRDKGVQILEQRSDKVIDNPSLVYREAALAQRELIKLCNSYTRSDLVKRGAYVVPAIMSQVAYYFLAGVLISGLFVIIKFFFMRIGIVEDTKQ